MIPIRDLSVVINAPTTTMRDKEIFGGGFFDKIKKGLSVANNFTKKTGIISKLWKVYYALWRADIKVASALGYGIPGYGDSGGALNYSGGALNICGDSVYLVQHLQTSN